MLLLLSAMYLWDFYGISIAFAIRSFDPIRKRGRGKGICYCNCFVHRSGLPIQTERAEIATGRSSLSL